MQLFIHLFIYLLLLYYCLQSDLVFWNTHIFPGFYHFEYTEEDALSLYHLLLELKLTCPNIEISKHILIVERFVNLFTETVKKEDQKAKNKKKIQKHPLHKVQKPVIKLRMQKDFVKEDFDKLDFMISKKNLKKAKGKSPKQILEKFAAAAAEEENKNTKKEDENKERQSDKENKQDKEALAAEKAWTPKKQKLSEDEKLEKKKKKGKKDDKEDKEENDGVDHQEKGMKTVSKDNQKDASIEKPVKKEKIIDVKTQEAPHEQAKLEKKEKVIEAKKKDAIAEKKTDKKKKIETKENKDNQDY